MVKLVNIYESSIYKAVFLMAVIRKSFLSFSNDRFGINEVDGRTQFSVSGRGDFFESFGDFGKETSMNFEAAILVHGDDILNEAEIRVNISLT